MAEPVGGGSAASRVQMRWEGRFLTVLCGRLLGTVRPHPCLLPARRSSWLGIRILGFPSLPLQVFDEGAGGRRESRGLWAEPAPYTAAPGPLAQQALPLPLQGPRCPGDTSPRCIWTGNVFSPSARKSRGWNSGYSVKVRIEFFLKGGVGEGRETILSGSCDCHLVDDIS